MFTSCKKRRLSLKDVETDDAAEKAIKQTCTGSNESSFDTDSVSVMGVKNIKDTILDFLLFDNENYELFMHFADEEYIYRTVWKFNKAALISIKQRIDEFINNKSKQSDINDNNTEKTMQSIYCIDFVCNLYGNIQHLFGKSLYDKFRNIALSEFENKATQIQINSDCKLVHQSSKSMTFLFAAPRDITCLFDEEQLFFLNENEMRIDEINEFKLVSNDQHHFGILIANKISKMSIMLEFDANYEPKIVAFAMAYKTREIHTKNMMPSVQALYILNTGMVAINEEKTETCHLYIDHCSSEHELRFIELMSGSSNEERIPLNVHILNTLPSYFNLSDAEQHYDITCDVFEKYKPSISEEETSFLKRLDLSPYCQQQQLCGIKRGVLQFLDSDQNVYDFKFIPNKEHSHHCEFQLKLTGLSLNDSDQQKSMEFRTSDIPPHWQRMEVIVGRAQVIVDEFSDAMRTFAVDAGDTKIDINISWDDIPSNMTELCLPFASVDEIRKRFLFLFGNEDDDNTLTCNRVSKPIKLVFELPFSAKDAVCCLMDEIKPSFEAVAFCKICAFDDLDGSALFGVTVIVHMRHS